jgi:hypothetical protein
LQDGKRNLAGAASLRAPNHQSIAKSKIMPLTADCQGLQQGGMEREPSFLQLF